MRRSIWAAVVFSICVCNSVGQAATRTTLTGQIHSLANEVLGSLKEDPRLLNQPLRLGKFDGEGDASASNFGLRIEQMLRSELSSVMSEKAKHTLAGSYHFVTSDDPGQKDIKILFVTAQIKDDRGKQILPISVEINDTDNIFQVLRGTAQHRRNRMPLSRSGTKQHKRRRQNQHLMLSVEIAWPRRGCQCSRLEFSRNRHSTGHRSPRCQRT